jgi:hypothetical protein
MKKSVVLFVFLCVIQMYDCLSQIQGMWIKYEGKDVYLPSDYIDPSYSEAMRKSVNPDDPGYAEYLHDHLFPLPQDENYQGKLEQWWMHNKMYYPQYLPTGNSFLDSARLETARVAWMNVNRDLFTQLSGIASSLSIEDFNFLCSSFPRRLSTGNPTNDEKRYLLEIEEWIRLYSFEKYELIAPVFGR